MMNGQLGWEKIDLMRPVKNLVAMVPISFLFNLKGSLSSKWIVTLSLARNALHHEITNRDTTGPAVSLLIMSWRKPFQDIVPY